ncbi:MAG: 6,7-dimethyl-8-ribityllumazine synthase [Phycisphaerales bacterium]|nr:6,7-dimethyl-8-ribityllumazine synthase [Phycisphaerales bacterium]
MKTYKGNFNGSGARVGIVVSQFNWEVTNKLLEGSLTALQECRLNPDDISIYWVPGAFEIPAITRRLVQSNKFDLIVCLGAVIRGETSHYDYVCNEVSRGISQLCLTADIPIIFGVLTTNNAQQAFDRAGGIHGNKGYDVTRAGIEMVTLVKQL